MTCMCVAQADVLCRCSQFADNPQVLSPDNPFILVHNALVSNYDISEMVETHKKRRQTNPDVIMTMGVGRGGR
jgi:translation initiation factor eIF-2B subunit epsilon